jgi:hypothetical protein
MVLRKSTISWVEKILLAYRVITAVTAIEWLLGKWRVGAGLAPAWVLGRFF